MYAKKAYELAKLGHKGQVDKGGNDYISHPCAVADMLESDVEKAVAYLHDIVEDTDITIDDLKAYDFSNEIIEAIDVITKRKDISYDAYLKRVSSNQLAKKVKLADMIHNSDITRIKKPSDKDKERCEKYKRKIIKLKAL